MYLGNDFDNLLYLSSKKTYAKGKYKNFIKPLNKMYFSDRINESINLFLADNAQVCGFNSCFNFENKVGMSAVTKDGDVLFSSSRLPLCSYEKIISNYYENRLNYVMSDNIHEINVIKSPNTFTYFESDDKLTLCLLEIKQSGKIHTIDYEYLENLITKLFDNNEPIKINVFSNGDNEIKKYYLENDKYLITFSDNLIDEIRYMVYDYNEKIYEKRRVLK